MYAIDFVFNLDSRVILIFVPEVLRLPVRHPIGNVSIV